MSKTSPILALMAAFAAASASAAPMQDDELTSRENRRAYLQQQLRDVRVELYCDHQDHALQMMRDTRRQLSVQHDDVSERGVEHLDRAIWAVRHGDTDQALNLLQDAHRQG
ncbi:hypothetical protein SAMN05216359_10892 [Roseateles sp. YR242]|uniref:hypothetical protein n=1 Tax=Roseateles sp. YR242 TaxID=1855305 RepID=UPI0008BC81CF|nr:hypothetical protein [Roseateles sp. YR242]SEL37726.1 hypothetical protein SAMN05216359_10892 [Roseateles sp. YR242]